MMTLYQLRKKMELEQRHDITAKSIARLAGISASSYCRYESGKAVPNVLIAANLALALHVDLLELVGIIRATVEDDHTVAPAGDDSHGPEYYAS